MTWILLLIQLLPSIIQLVQLIWDAIAKLPKAERPAARKLLRAIAKDHVTTETRLSSSCHGERCGKHYDLASPPEQVRQELVTLLHSIKARTTT